MILAFLRAPPLRVRQSFPAHHRNRSGHSWPQVARPADSGPARRRSPSADRRSFPSDSLCSGTLRRTGQCVCRVFTVDEWMETLLATGAGVVPLIVTETHECNRNWPVQDWEVLWGNAGTGTGSEIGSASEYSGGSWSVRRGPKYGIEFLAA